jgi:nicotinate-nucleotide adenylyltransferase
MNRKKIGLLGGTFDPVHNGHLRLAMEARKQASLDKVVFIPAKLQPFKLTRKITSPAHRLAMLKLAVEPIPEFEVSEYELNSPNVSYTYDTLRQMRRVYPEDTLYFILGADALLKIRLWKNADEILQRYHFIVAVRPGYPDENLTECIAQIRKVYNTDIIRVTSPMPDISSTQIRENTQNNLVPEEVRRYMRKNAIY